MTDLEMTRLCAEAMKLRNEYRSKLGGLFVFVTDEYGEQWSHYDPLHDDAQAMALVKKFELQLSSGAFHPMKWTVWREFKSAESVNLNRAIVECVAKMQAAKK